MGGQRVEGINKFFKLLVPNYAIGWRWVRGDLTMF